MLILGLEFSSPQRTAALVENNGTDAKTLGMVSDHGLRAAKPLMLIEALLKQAGARRESIDALAVGLGPGSYTGIRSAISLALGWRLAREIKLAGASSVECLALQAREIGSRGNVHIAIDAQRNEMYLATYQLAADRQDLLHALRIVSAEELRLSLERAPGLLIGPEVTRWSPLGRVVFPEAQAAARLAQQMLDSGGTETLEPIYLRETAFVKARPARLAPV